MKPSKHLIIRLLVNDMKHEQLIAGLHRLGFESDLHGSDLSDVVAELMGITNTPAKECWLDRYMEFLAQATQLEITGDGHNLLPLAERCYAALQKIS